MLTGSDGSSVSVYIVLCMEYISHSCWNYVLPALSEHIYGGTCVYIHMIHIQNFSTHFDEVCHTLHKVQINFLQMNHTKNLCDIK